MLSVGCDVVSISRFRDLIEKDVVTLDKIFLPHERNGASLERLAGIFAAKEAAMKALAIPAGHWHDIWVTHHENGAPELHVNLPQADNQELALSISHDGEYAMAVVIVS